MGARRHWRPLLGLGIVAVLVGVIALEAGPLFRAEIDLITQSGGKITQVNFVTINNETQLDIYAAAGVGQADAVRLACNLIEPILVRDGYGGASFAVYDRAGNLLADDTTSCSGVPPLLIPPGNPES